MTKLIIEQVAKQLGVKVTELEYDIDGVIYYRCKHGMMHYIYYPMKRFIDFKPRLPAPCRDKCCKRFKDIKIKIIEED